ncbi:MAG: helix-turn-helix transcriptional regulator [Sphingomonadales bacterium]|nr:helix-turn-helix transcriptional regulator [Sphingomonadales bacterium]
MSVKVNKDSTNIDRARLAWGENMPGWVQLLAAACDATSQREAGDRIGKSNGYVSRVLNNRYPGDLEEAEKIVRAAWGGEEVNCPIWGLLPLANCMRHRRRTDLPINLMHRLHRRHCPTCPNNTDAHLDDAEDVL